MILQKQPKRWVLAGAAVILTGGALFGRGVLAADEDKETSVALPAEQVISAIRAAVKAKPGQVLEVEAESEGGKTHCDVKIIAADKQVYEVAVEAASGKVVSVEADHEEHEGNEGEDDKD